MAEMIEKNISSYRQIEELVVSKIASSHKKRVALVAPSDLKALTAIVRGVRRELIEPVLIGDEALVKKKAQENGLEISGFEFIDLGEPKMALAAASKMAEASEIDLIFKGKLKTVDLLEQLFSPVSEFLTADFPVHIGVFKVAAYPKLLFLSDGFVNGRVDLKCKIGIINQVVRFAGLCGIQPAKAAILAAVEVVYPQMVSTMDGAVLSKMAERKQIKNCQIEGPLSLDIAVDSYAAESKGILNSEVAGQADLLIAPDIATANGVYKAMTLFAKADTGGLIIGGKVPICLNLETESPDNYYNSLLLGLLSI